MDKELRILILEDVATEAELVERELRKAGISFVSKLVETKNGFEKALKDFVPSLILSDYSLPRYDCMSALAHAREHCPEVPFIFVSGAIGEEMAIEVLKSGATDYVLKSRLSRLGLVVKRALREMKLRAEQKRAVEKLKESENRYRTLVETMPDGLNMIDDKGNFLFGNERFCQILGYEREELLGHHYSEFMDEENRKLLEAQLEKRRAGVEQPYELEWTKKDGSRVMTHMSPKAILDKEDNFTGSFAVITDITERKRTQDERDRLVTAVEQVAEIIVITDREGNIQYVNPAFEHITGYTRQEAIGENPRMLKSGKQDKAFYRKMWATILKGQVWEGRLVNKRKEGDLYEEEASISPVLDASGNITNFVAVKRDVTDEMKMQRQLRQAQKMEAIGTLAGGIAHDFNNILGAIIGYTELLEYQIPEDSALYGDLHEVLKAGNRAKDLVRQILAFSRQSEEERIPLEIAPIVKEALKLLRSSLPSFIEIVQDVKGELGSIFADPTQVHQVLMNLCTNAAHAMGEHGGMLEVRTDRVELDERGAAAISDLQPGAYVRLTVSDTGHGMKRRVMERIFEPYFTTKEKGVGTGLGLSVAHGIVKSYGGAITVYSEPEKGSTFHVYFRQAEYDEVMIAAKPDESLPRGKERILFVDDEPALANLGKRMLERLGYEVTISTRSEEALELFRRQPDRFDLVVTDTTMPGMRGDQLGERIMGIRPDMPVILCSGFSERVTKEVAKEIGIREFLMKPVDIADLAGAIRRVLDKGFYYGK